jgi:hypothetical protein
MYPKLNETEDGFSGRFSAHGTKMNIRCHISLLSERIASLSSFDWPIYGVTDKISFRGT